MDEQQLGRLLRAIRLRRGMRQVDVAQAAGVSHATVSLIERGHSRRLSLDTLGSVTSAVDIRLELSARWRGGDADRLVNVRHSLLAESVAKHLGTMPGWVVEPEVSFSIYGERGVVDQLGWHQTSSQLLVIELKTEIVDVNELLGTLDRKARLARSIAAARGWKAREVSDWLIISDTRTNRRHVASHAALLRSRLRLDGRQFGAFLRNPGSATSGLAFWTNANRSSTGPENGGDHARLRCSPARLPAGRVPGSLASR